MSSWFPEHKKYFVNRGLHNTALEERISVLLCDKQAKYRLHTTLCVIHIKEDTPFDHYINSNECIEDLSRLFVKEQSQLTFSDARYELLGINPQFFSLVIPTDQEIAKQEFSVLCDYFCEKMNLLTRNVVIEGKHEYVEFFDSKTNEEHALLSIGREKLFHITLLSSADLKRHNKKLYEKEYQKTDNRLEYLSLKFGETDSLIFEIDDKLSISTK